jgi:hypothetical protein
VHARPSYDGGLISGQTQTAPMLYFCDSYRSGLSLISATPAAIGWAGAQDAGLGAVRQACAADFGFASEDDATPLVCGRP